MEGRLALAGLLCSALLSAASSAQIPRRLEDCLPIPSLAQDLEQRQEEAQAQQPEPHIKLVRLVFRGQTGLPRQELAQIARSLKDRTYDDNSSWLEELAVRIQDAFQQRGYFKPFVEYPRPRQLLGSRTERRFAVNVLVDAGNRYRLNRIDIRNGTQFAYAEARAFFHIHDGDIFDTHAIQQGIEDMRKAYQTRGFLNFASVPSLVIDEDRAFINLLLDLEEGQQFRLGHVKILGLDPLISQKLLHESGLEPGNIFDASRLDEFFRRNKLILPRDAAPEEDTERVMDEQTGTVVLTMDFRTCPRLLKR